jgi:hypothetical protein
VSSEQRLSPELMQQAIVQLMDDVGLLIDPLAPDYLRKYKNCAHNLGMRPHLALVRYMYKVVGGKATL